MTTNSHTARRCARPILRLAGRLLILVLIWLLIVTVLQFLEDQSRPDSGPIPADMIAVTLRVPLGYRCVMDHERASGFILLTCRFIPHTGQ